MKQDDFKKLLSPPLYKIKYVYNGCPGWAKPTRIGIAPTGTDDDAPKWVIYKYPKNKNNPNARMLKNKRWSQRNRLNFKKGDLVIIPNEQTRPRDT